MSVQCVAWLAVLVLANLPTLALAQSSSCPGIHVQILNIRNSTGTVDCALFDAPVGFPIEVLRSATNVMVIKVRHTQARCDFEDIPPGTYALAVIHDENMNGKLDTNWLGIPTEGYGFSNDAKGSARRAIVRCRQLRIRRAKPRADDPLAVLSTGGTRLRPIRLLTGVSSGSRHETEELYARSHRPT